MDSSFIPAQNDLGLAYLQKGMYADAEKQFLRVNDLSKTFGTTSFETHESMLVNLDVDPLFDNLHSDPRFSDLKKRIGFWQ